MDILQMYSVQFIVVYIAIVSSFIILKLLQKKLHSILFSLVILKSNGPSSRRFRSSVCDHSLAEIVGSHPAEAVNVSLF